MKICSWFPVFRTWCCVVALLGGAALPATAKLAGDGSTPSATAPAPDRPTPLAATLQSFMPQPEPIDLRNAQNEYQLSLPIASRMDIRKATLHLVANNSMSLLAPRSQLVIRLDGVVVGQIPLDPKLPQIQATIGLPADLLKPGYRRLTFAVAQHYTNECEDPSAAELWTQIDSARSWIELQGGLRGWRPTLAQLPDVFDPKVWGPAQLTVITPQTIDPAVLRWGSLAAQAVALQLGYAPLTVRQFTPVIDAQSDALLRIDTHNIDGDAVIVGTAKQIAPWLAPEIAQQITGPYLGIVPVNTAATRFAVIASGRDAAEVDRALLAMASLQFPYPDAMHTLVQQVKPAVLGKYAGAKLLQPNARIRFADLGLTTSTFKGMYGRETLEFSLPPDLWAPENAYVHLKLHFAYGAGLREDSVVNVFINDQFQAAIPLNSPSGGVYQAYDLAIPLVSFKPGANQIRFEPAMMPLVTGKCLAINMQNLQFTLFADSQIEIPNAAHLTSLPNLSLLARTGFPYTAPAQGGGVALRIATPSRSEAATAWTLLAKLAQIQRIALTDVIFGVGTTDLPRDRDLIVVGAADRIPSHVLDKAPLRLGTSSQAPYPVAALPPGPGEISWFEQFTRWLRTVFQLTPQPAAAQVTWITQQGRDLGAKGVLMQYASPANGKRVITVLAAANDAYLLTQTDALVQPGVWARLQGDLVLWREDREFATQQVGSSFTVGNAGWTVKFGYLLSRHPWAWGIALAILLVALALATLRMLMRFKHRHHRAVNEASASPETAAQDDHAHTT